MTTIDHQQAAVEAMIEEAKNHRWLTIPDERQECDCGFVISAFPLEYGEDAYKSHVAEANLTAAAPHLRAAWAADLVEKLKAEINDVDWDYGLNADAYLNGLRRVIALLEGGGEDK